MEKVVFLDRDGVINRGIEDGYVSNIKLLEVFPQALDAISRLTEAGFKVIIISNQAGVGRGLYDQQILSEITRVIIDKVEEYGGKIYSVNYCVHRPDENCPCRKPKTLLFKQATNGIMVNFPTTYMVGDSEKDITAGNALGCKTILVLSGHTKTKEDTAEFKIQPDFIAKDLLEAVNNFIAKNKD